MIEPFKISLPIIAAFLDDHWLFVERHDRDLRPYPRDARQESR